MNGPSGTPEDRVTFRPAAPVREFDALAELFLGERDATPDVLRFPREGDDETTPRAVHEPAPGAMSGDGPVIEALLMGHLPVRSGPWALQYAASVARQDGAGVTLVRMGPGEAAGMSNISIDFLGAHPASAAKVMTLNDAMAHAARGTQRWILLVGALDEATLLGTTGIDQVTVLSGANEAAVVDAYRMLKAMSDTGGGEDAEPGVSSARRVHVAIMGADAERSDAAGRKVQHAAKVFLDMDVALASPVGKMGPTGSTPVFRGTAAVSHEDVVRMIRSEWSAAPETTTSVAPANTAQPRSATVAEVKTHGAMPLASQLAMFIEGLMPLDIECPVATHVELATDGRGRLHVLARGDGAEHGEAMQRLAEASAWAIAHRKLIGKAAGVRLDESTIEQHIFAGNARQVRWLMDAPVHVHLITRAVVRGEMVTVACALN